MRKSIQWLHMHLGLLCLPYLIIFGISSLVFNHQLGTDNDGPPNASWDSPIRIAPLTDQRQQAEEAAAALGLFGWVRYWDIQLEPDNTLIYHLERPGKHYFIKLAPDRLQARAEMRYSRPGQLAHELHGLMFVPGSAFAGTWQWYTRLCAVFVLFAAGSGIYLFATHKGERAIGWLVFVGAITTSMAMMIFITAS
jgi:hypothetical protein